MAGAMGKFLAQEKNSNTSRESNLGTYSLEPHNYQADALATKLWLPPNANNKMLTIKLHACSVR